MTEATVQTSQAVPDREPDRDGAHPGRRQFIYKVKTGMKPHREDLEHLPAIRNEFDDKVDLRVD